MDLSKKIVSIRNSDGKNSGKMPFLRAILRVCNVQIVCLDNNVLNIVYFKDYKHIIRLGSASGANSKISYKKKLNVVEWNEKNKWISTSCR